MDGNAKGARLDIVAEMLPGTARGDARASGAVFDLVAILQPGGTAASNAVRHVEAQTMPSLIYDSALFDLVTGGIDAREGDFRVLLVDSSYVPDKANHRCRSDVRGEVMGPGYSAGGPKVAVTVERVDGETVVSLGGAAWDSATFSAASAIYYHANGSPSDDKLIACIGLGEVQVANGTLVLDRSRLIVRETSAAA